MAGALALAVGSSPLSLAIQTSTGLLEKPHDLVAGFPQKEGSKSRRLNEFSDLVSKTTDRHFDTILWVTQVGLFNVEGTPWGQEPSESFLEVGYHSS